MNVWSMHLDTWLAYERYGVVHQGFIAICRYAVSKTALVALTKALAEELGPDGIRVNCVAPGGASIAVISLESPAYVQEHHVRAHTKACGMPD